MKTKLTDADIAAMKAAYANRSSLGCRAPYCVLIPIFKKEKWQDHIAMIDSLIQKRINTLRMRTKRLDPAYRNAERKRNRERMQKVRNRLTNPK